MSWETEQGERLLRVEKDWVWDYLALLGHWPKREAGYYFNPDIDHFVIYAANDDGSGACILQGIRYGEPVWMEFKISIAFERELRHKALMQARTRSGKADFSKKRPREAVGCLSSLLQ